MLFLQLCVDRNKAPSSDGLYTWLYARSLVYDHDIDFTNDYKLCGDPYGRGVRRGTEHPDDPFYAGPSVVWVPVLAAVRALSHDVPADDPGCKGTLAVRTMRVAPVLGALTVWMLYLIARRWAGDGVAAVSAGLLGMGTPLLNFAALSTSYSHAYDAFWAAACILAALRASERRSLGWWAITGALVGVDLLQRPVSAFYVIVPAALAFATAPPPRWRHAVPALALVGAGVALFGLLPQALIYEYLYGHYWVGAPHGRYYMVYGHAHPWLLLFAPRGGLFFTSPIAWLAVPGLVAGLRDPRTRVLTAALIVSAAATIWLSAAALDWHASWTFGARRLTSIVALLALPTSATLSRLERWLRARPSRSIHVLAAGACAFVALATAGEAYVPGGEHGRSQEELYGGAGAVVWKWADRLGDLAVLPAEVVFRLRYGLPMNAFRAASEPRYARNYRTMERPVAELELRASEDQLTGFTKVGDDMVMTGKRSTFVFTPEWPYATDLSVQASATPGTELRVGRRTWTGTVWYGSQTLASTVGAVKYSIPVGGFDSGLFELVFERADDGGKVVIRSIRIEDDAVYGPPL